jgi:hypothetical protein
MHGYIDKMLQNIISVVILAVSVTEVGSQYFLITVKKTTVSVQKETRGDTVPPNTNHLTIFDTALDGLLSAKIVLERMWKEVVIAYFKGIVPPSACRGKQ